MSDSDLDHDLGEISRRIQNLCVRVQGDPRHKALLREELLRHHVELVSRGRVDAKPGWRPFGVFPPPRILAPALAVAVALTAALWAVQLSGRSSSQSAEAARLSDALARTVPTLTSWHMTLHRIRGNTASANRCDTLPLAPGQRLYVRGDRSFIYSHGQWHQFTTFASGGQCPADWQWAFAQLPARLAHSGTFDLLPARAITGRLADGVRYSIRQPNREQVIAVAWVDQRTGLIIRLERTVLQANRLVELDSADYRYDRTP